VPRNSETLEANTERDVDMFGPDVALVVPSAHHRCAGNAGDKPRFKGWRKVPEL